MSNADAGLMTIVTEALARADAAERAAYLERACGTDAELRQRVEVLLAAHAGAGGNLEPERTGAYKPAAPDATGTYEPAKEPTILSSVPNDSLGSVIAGRYTLVEVIGEGGMGSVYLATQSEPVKRKVALKLIKAGMDSKAILARFDAERQALALMDHPNIARIYDGGVTERGQPFFVMELVRGVPLTDYCDAKRLSIEARLNLFVQICQAVQHAHQKGIIHRDLKPGNVLVTKVDGRPVPKVIDFGVAKATEQRLTDLSLADTGAIVGTPAYMSPEQADPTSMDIDTRSDVYALGVMLYELLTGSLPIDPKQFKRGAILEMLRMVREVEPPRPSTKLSTAEALPNIAAQRSIEPGKLTRLLRGELDWVVMKALEKDRTRRYDTANGLARDIQRYLANEVVEARPPSRGYRLRKFVRRNRVPVLAAGLIFLALVTGIIGTTIGFLRAEAERTKAEAAAEKERQAKVEAEAEKRKAEERRQQAIEFRDKALDALRATTGEDVEKLLGEKKHLTANEREYLEAIAKRWQTFALKEGTDEQSRAVAAEGHFRVGLLWQKLGRRAEARPEYEQAVSLWEKLVAEFPGVPEYRRILAGSHHNTGKLLRDLGKHPEAEEYYRKALVLLKNLTTEFPALPGFRSELATTFHNLGWLLADQWRQSEAEEQYGLALAIREKLTTEFPAVPDYRRDLAGTHNNFGVLLMVQEKRAEAEEQLRRGLALRKKLADDFPTVAEYRRESATSHNNLGVLLERLGRRAEAEEQFLLGLGLRERLVAEFPAIPDYRSDLASAHNNLGVIFARMGEHKKAEEQYRRGLAHWEKLMAEFPTILDYRNGLATCLHDLGVLHGYLQKRTEAEECYRRAQSHFWKLAAEFPNVPDYRRDLAKSYGNLGLLLAGLGKRAEAEEQYRKGLAIEEKLAAEFPTIAAYRIGLGGSCCNLGHLIRDGGQVNDSLTWYVQAIATLAPVHRAEPQDVRAKLFLRNSHWGRARAYDQLGKHADAVKDWDRVIELSIPAEQPVFRVSRATSRLKAGQVAEAVAEVAELTKASNWNPVQWYNFACVYAIASDKIADKKQEYADRAVELLQKAIQAGWTNAAHIKKDTDLDPLRERADFKMLLTELEKKFPPVQEKN